MAQINSDNLGKSPKTGTITVDTTARSVASLIAAAAGVPAERIFAAGLLPAANITWSAEAAGDRFTAAGGAWWYGVPAVYWPAAINVRCATGTVACGFWMVER